MPYTGRDLLRDLFLPHRTAWSALAVAWIMLGVFALVQRAPRSNPAVLPPNTEAVAHWLSQIKSHETLAQAYLRP